MAAVIAVALGGPAQAATPGYHDFAAVERQLQGWARQHPEATLLTLGRSAGGRPLYVLQIAGPGGTPPDERSAVFVGANVAGYHNAGTEAALHLAETLLGKAGKVGDGAHQNLLRTTTFYIAPALNPDAHDGMFAKPRARRGGNASKLDRDRDGLEAEDPADDLDGDGRITRMRIPDPAGEWLPHPEDPRLMIRADAMKERAGAFRLVSEGHDDDGDGEPNEDGGDGVWPDRNFPHAFPHYAPEAGPWASYAPETRAVLDFILARRNLVAAVVYGPANNLLAAPQSLGGGNSDPGAQKFALPPQAAEMLGLDGSQEYTLDEVWAVAQDNAFVRQNNISKEQLGQFLGAGAATRVDAGDQAYFDRLAEGYKERLEKAGLAKDRPAAQYGKGGLTPWLYYQAGLLALELDVWGVPKAEKKAEAGGAGEALTLEKAAAMSTEDFIALGEEKIAAFLKDNKVPPQFGAQQVLGALRGGQATPKAMVDRIRQMGGGGAATGGGSSRGGSSGTASEAEEREREVLAWIDQHQPGAFTPWKAVTLKDGTRAEVGGLDPFAEIAPPAELLQPALAVHTETVLDLAGKLPRVEIVALEAEEIGGGVYRVRAVAANRAFLPTHTKMAARARAFLPVRLELKDNKDGKDDKDGKIERITGPAVVTAERLDGVAGTLQAEWLVRAPRGTEVTVEALTQNAGRDSKSVQLGKGK